MKEFIGYTARQLVDQPEDVMVEEVCKNDKVIFTLKVAKLDIGKVIDRNGRTAFALRTLTAAVGKKSGMKVMLEIAG